MIPKYSVEYKISFRKHDHPAHYGTDDPVACEEFLGELLERSYKILAIKHEGIDLSSHDFDKMIKAAACTMAARHVCSSLGIKPEEEKYRFGLAA